MGLISEIKVGIPYDKQLDNFWVSEWGILDSENDPPEWIQFVNKTIENGIIFKVNPPADELLSDKIVFFYEL